MTMRQNFFGLSDDKLYYDERKKRFVFLENTHNIAQKDYKSVHFNEVTTIITVIIVAYIYIAFIIIGKT